MPAKIVVIGSSNTDMIVKTSRIPSPGETIVGGAFAMAAGGKGANQAVAAARLGARVEFVGCVGADMFGDSALREIGSAGVGTRCVRRAEGAASGVALIAVDDAGQNAIVVAPGANDELRPEDVDAAQRDIARADVVVLQCEIPIETVAHAVEVARAAGTRVVLNPAPACALPDSLLAGVEILTPNEFEACALLGIPYDAAFDPVAAGQALRKRGPRTVVVTLGDRGAVAVTDAGAIDVAPFPVTAVDATAAGDCFTAALAVGIAEGSSLPEALRFATAAAAISVTKLGAQPSLPTRAEVDNFLARP